VSHIIPFINYYQIVPRDPFSGRISPVTAHKIGAVAPGVASPLTRSSSQDVSDELPAGRKKFQL
jgi:hypothetical protein